MLGTIRAGLTAAGKLLGIVEKAQEKAEREEYRESGRQEQKNATLESKADDAAQANRIEEDVAGMSDADVSERVPRRRNRKPRKG